MSGQKNKTQLKKKEFIRAGTVFKNLPCPLVSCPGFIFYKEEVNRMNRGKLAEKTKTERLEITDVTELQKRCGQTTVQERRQGSVDKSNICRGCGQNVFECDCKQ